MIDDPPRLAGRYELGDLLGRGGMAEVRRGVDLKLGRSVAIKLLKADLAADSGALKRFQREVHAVAILNHAGIAAVYDTGERVDPISGLAVPYLVMELVEGATLREVLDGEGPLAPDRALEVVGVVLDALEHSHAAGIVHRDIKPSNIMITPSGAIKVMDFGIARAVTETTSGLTGTAMVIGTAAYFSPEQAQGQQVDLRSDVYSTGCLMYELLLGRPPFVGESSISVAYQHVREVATPPSQLDPTVPPELDTLVLKALAKNPDARYQSAAEMAADVDRVKAGQPVRAVPAEMSTEVLPATEQLAVADPASLTAPTAALVPVPAPPPPPTEVAERTPIAAPPPRRSGGRTALVAILAALVLAGVAFGLYRMLGSGAGGVTVPSVLGSERSAAEQTLVDAGLQPTFRHVIGPDDESLDTVIAQNPAEGTQVDPGTTVLAEINVGPATTEIPDDLVGRDLDKVLDELADAGFVNVSAVPVTNPPADADEEEVLAVEPGEGEPAALEQDIVVRYAGSAGQQTTEPSDDETDESSGKGNESEATDEPTSDNEGSNEDSEGSNEDDEGSNEDNEGSNEDNEPTTEEPTDDPTTEEPTEEPTASASESAAGESSGGPSASSDAEELEAGGVGE